MFFCCLIKVSDMDDWFSFNRKQPKQVLKEKISLGFQIVPDDNQLSDHLLRVHRQIHSRLRSNGVRSDTGLLSRVREPVAGHGETWAQLGRRAGRVWKSLHRRSRLWELCYIRHGRVGFLLPGKPFIWSLLALINGAVGRGGWGQTHMSVSPKDTCFPVIYPRLTPV